MPLARWSAAIQNEFGDLVTDAFVEVKIEGSGFPLASIFSDRQGTIPRANPFQMSEADDGVAFFHALGGAYRVRAYKNISGNLWEKEWRYVGVGTAQENDITSFDDQGYTQLWSTNTAAPPPERQLEANNADLSLATHLYVSILTTGGVNFQNWLLGTDSTGKTFRNLIRVISAESGLSVTYEVNTATLVPASGSDPAYVDLSLAAPSGVTSFTNGERMILQREITGGGGASGGHKYQFNTATSGDPGVGKLLFNNAALASVTQINISETSDNGEGLAAWIATWDDSTSAIRGRIEIYEETTPSNFVIYNVTGAVTDNGAYDAIAVAHNASGGSFSASDILRVNFYRAGDTGSTGATGATGAAAGLKYQFNTATSGDPGSGKLLLNNATLASATAINISETSGDSAALASLLATFDDSTNTVKGRLEFYKEGSPGTFAVYNVSGSLTDSGAYDTLTITHVASAGTFANNDVVRLSFARSGDVGPTGSTGLQGAASGQKYQFNTATSGDPTSGKLLLNNATVASATAINISETSADSEALAAWIATFDDSTSTIKGVLRIVKESSPSTFAIFNITGTVTDNGAYDTLSLTHVASGGTFANNDQVRMLFQRTGDLGATGNTGSTGATGAAAGHKYQFNTATSGDPGSGKLLVNNATLGSATALNISETSADSEALAAWLATWDDSTNTVKGRVEFSKEGTPATFAIFNITGVITDSGAYDTFTISPVASGGTFANNDQIRVQFSRAGDLGATGTAGTNGLFSGVESIKTADFNAVAADVGKNYIANSATPITSTLAAPATLGAGWGALFDNIGAGGLIISGTFDDGSTSITLNQGQSAAVFSNGTVHRAMLRGGGGGSSVTAQKDDTQVGNGVATTFTLNFVPLSENTTWPFLGGILQANSTFSLSGNTITFDQAVPSGVRVEVLGLTVGASQLGAAPRIDVFTGDGATTAFTLGAAPTNQASLLVALGGVPQDPRWGQSYNVAGATMTFTVAPASGAKIIAWQVEQLAIAVPADVSVTASKLFDIIIAPQIRSSLQSGVPVSTADQTAKTHIYSMPYQGAMACWYNGSAFLSRRFTELDMALDATNHLSGNNYDLFYTVYNGNLVSGTGPAWSAGAVAGSDTARGTGAGSTELELFNGLWVNKNSITLRLDSSTIIVVAARQALFVSTIRCSANGQTQMKFGSSAAGGGEAWIGLWNNYNRRRIAGTVKDSNTGWVYTTATLRPLDNSVTNRASFVTGLAEDDVEAMVAAEFFNSTAATVANVGVGYDSTSVALSLGGAAGNGTNNALSVASAAAKTPLGFHYLQALEIGYSSGGGTTTWAPVTSTGRQSGLRYSMMG